MRINSSGNVAIGHTSPEAKLDVDADSNQVAFMSRDQGSATYPAFGFAGQVDSNGNRGTGIFLPTDGALGFAAHSAERMRVNPTGVGIGTTSPTQALHVVGNGLFTGGLTVGDSAADTFITRGHTHLATSGNNVGIGTTSPAEKLHVVGQASLQNAGNTNRGNIILGPHGSGTEKWSTLAGTHYNDATGSGNGSGAAGNMIIGCHATSGGNEVYIGGGPYELNPATAIRFNTHGTNLHGLGGSERMRITSTGNVGIGLTAPSRPLHVFNGANAEAAIFSSDIGTNAFIKFVPDDSDLGGRIGFADDEFVVQCHVGSQSFDTTLRVDNSANLKLGTTGSVSGSNKIVMRNSSAPSGSVTDSIILFAEDVSSSAELKVRDEAGNVTTLSPHNFNMIPEGPSEDMAWAYYSEKGNKKINVDMLRVIRALEKLTGEQFIYEN